MSQIFIILSSFIGIIPIVTTILALTSVEQTLNQIFNNILNKGKEEDKNRKQPSGEQEDDNSIKHLDQIQAEENAIETSNLREALGEIDKKLDAYADLVSCLKKLGQLKSAYPGDPNILWRIGETYQKIAEKSDGTRDKISYIEKGIKACQDALDVDKNQSDSHKWMAILVGYKGHVQGVKQKIQSGKLFKKHLDIALSLSPSDAFLHFMFGRFCYEVASLKWVEKQIAKTVFPESMGCTFERALQHFLEAEKCTDTDWKENKLFIAKCYLKQGNREEALEWLKKAKASPKTPDGAKLEREIESLLNNYSEDR